MWLPRLPLCYSDDLSGWSQFAKWISERVVEPLAALPVFIDVEHPFQELIEVRTYVFHGNVNENH
ncbi:MAG: hypothetical protein OES38_05950 [Gammaproteobacteria bacterium]|nr:hypothetical protein [Gammaproteobacteria bacterium]